MGDLYVVGAGVARVKSGRAVVVTVERDVPVFDVCSGEDSPRGPRSIRVVLSEESHARALLYDLGTAIDRAFGESCGRPVASALQRPATRAAHRTVRP
ncbi:hypothetical protein IHV25_01625 [Phaeovibrio sulfidiphilus]|uniref:Uncharacterized protein n=1 Tax=Phaeovibrio sulfidiphilus TaxID=1220600 RepID=A0A8J6YX69_9PROT|nr:hypothetical protein [Phaeovibrio sulfidiphilus]MBE1236353.1 hypothetical protein [Phaeovibrio sulfidiphilus]